MEQVGKDVKQERLSYCLCRTFKFMYSHWFPEQCWKLKTFSSIYEIQTWMLWLLWEAFGYVPFLFKLYCILRHKGRSIKTWMGEFSVEELVSTAQYADLNTFGLNLSAIHFHHLSVSWRIIQNSHNYSTLPSLKAFLEELLCKQKRTLVVCYNVHLTRREKKKKSVFAMFN